MLFAIFRANTNTKNDVCGEKESVASVFCEAKLTESRDCARIEPTKESFVVAYFCCGISSYIYIYINHLKKKEINAKILQNCCFIYNKM